MKNNPFRLDFGAEPGLYIPRHTEQQKVMDVFTAESPSSHIFLLTGARGSGKTVLMTSISHSLREDKKWIHVDLNPEGNLLKQLAAYLYQESKRRFPRLKLGVSFRGIELSAEKEDKYTDVQFDLDEMIVQLAKKRIRILITIDEISNAKNIREFTAYFQHCLRERMPVFVLMTGLYKNIRALQNNRTQTFLKRAPKIDLTPLSISRIVHQYEETFGIDTTGARELAHLTAGYSYGFQILGFLLYEAGMDHADRKIVAEYRSHLEDGSYEKIWEELSAGERRVAIAIAQSERNAAIKDVRERLDMDSNNFSSYQNILQKSGILSEESPYGRVDFCLPFFREYLLTKQ